MNKLILKLGILLLPITPTFIPQITIFTLNHYSWSWHDQFSSNNLALDFFNVLFVIILHYLPLFLICVLTFVSIKLWNKYNLSS